MAESEAIQSLVIQAAIQAATAAVMATREVDTVPKTEEVEPVWQKHADKDTAGQH